MRDFFVSDKKTDGIGIVKFNITILNRLIMLVLSY